MEDNIYFKFIYETDIYGAFATMRYIVIGLEIQSWANEQTSCALAGFLPVADRQPMRKQEYMCETVWV